jgi:hypothetical protein
MISFRSSIPALISLLTAGLFCHSSRAQQLEITPLDTFSIQADCLHAEPGGTLLFSRNEAIYRMNAAGDTLATQSLKQYGPVSDISARQKLRIYLFFGQQMEVLTLDNTLSPQGEPASLLQLDLPGVTHIAGSVNNSLWMFDQAGQVIIRLSATLQQELQSQSMIAILGEAITVHHMQDMNGELFVTTTSGQLLHLDRFGTLVAQNALPQPGLVHPLSREVLVSDATSISLFSADLQLIASTPLPVANPQQLSVSGDRLYLAHKGNVYVYSISLRKNRDR